MSGDVRYALRSFLKTPGLAAVIVLTLAVGIGANTAIFSVVNTLLLQPLPYTDADRLAVIWEHNLPRDRKNNVVSPGNFIHWREMQHSFVDLAAVSGMQSLNLKVTLTGAGEPEEVPVQAVSASFFPLLGVQPARGRAFTAEEDRPQSRVVVLGDRLWRRRYGADPSIVEKTITIQGAPYTVVGVMPSGFSYLDKSIELWIPIGFPADARTPRGRWLNVVGRLKPGVTFEQAQEDMKRVHAELARQYPNFNTGWTARVVPLRQELTGDVRPALLVLLGAVVFVLLIACANVANLLLARATSRQRELAVRAALGAGRGRIVRQLLAESLVLATSGGAAGLLLAWWALRVFRTVAAANLPIQRLEAVGLDWRVVAFTIGASLLSGVFFGLIPALTTSGPVLTEALKEGGRSGSASRGHRMRSAFVVLEVALALVLLVGAGLLVRSFARLLDVDPGFNPAHTITMRVSLPSTRYREDESHVRFFQRLFERIDALPDVQASGAVSFLPLAGTGAATGFHIVGRPTPPRGEEPVCDVRVAASQYFTAMGITLLRGRLFDERDPNDSRNRVVINETMARQYWPNEDPLGKRVRISWNDDREDEIVGVVSDVRQTSLDTKARATTYWPYPRFPYGTMTLAIRAGGDPSPLARAVTTLVHEQDPQLAVAAVKTMDDVVADSVADRRLTMVLLAFFAAAALMLAAVGVYGVIGYMVTERTREIGIRMALGAQPGRVLTMVVSRALLLTMGGIALGAAGALALTGLMTKLLLDVKPADPLTFAAVAALLALVALAASLGPARRATRVDPVLALRTDA